MPTPMFMFLLLNDIKDMTQEQQLKALEKMREGQRNCMNNIMILHASLIGVSVICGIITLILLEVQRCSI